MEQRNFRMKVSTRPSQASRVEARAPSHRPTDIAGILLLAAAAIVLVGLATQNSGLIGQAVSLVLKNLFGRGAWVVPFLLAFQGVILVRGKNVSLKHLAWGLGLLFLSLVGAFATPVNGDYFDPGTVGATGGYLGALIAAGLGLCLGAAKAVGLIALGLIGLVLCVDVPVRNLVHNLRPKRRVVAGEAKPVQRPERPKLLLRTPVEEETSSPEVTQQLETKRLKPVVRHTEQTTSLETQAPEPKEGYQLPPNNLLAEALLQPKRSQAEMQKNIEILERTLGEFGISADVVEVATGPTVTRYEIELGPGIKVNRITSLADNIAMSLSASQVRVEAPIPGKAAIGVEVPNSAPSTVTLRELCDDPQFRTHSSRLYIALGKDVGGGNRYADLTKMPHLLIGGATNAGKSIGLATLITSLLMRNTPKDVRLVMIDPKRVELTLFDHIPHLMCPVIKDVKEAAGVLRAVWREMDRRYDLFSNDGVRNIDGWNAKATFQDRLPYIVVVIDELADLMIQCGPEVETVIVRLAQLARAVGIHMVIATQRPSVDVITGLIKANIPSRLAFSVASYIDSRTILDMKGAEALIGRGDMLFKPIEAIKPLRIQGCFVSEKEIDAVCKFWRAQQKPEYVLDPIDDVAVADKEKEMGNFGEEADPLWEDAVRWAVDRSQASTSMLQRKFSIGFQRASRILDLMEERGIVGPRDGPRPRDVLVSPLEIETLFSGRPAQTNLELD
jgi:S-DNA-T family DNA segregation ATPase FtsK/SpoIIIE